MLTGLVERHLPCFPKRLQTDECLWFESARPLVTQLPQKSGHQKRPDHAQKRERVRPNCSFTRLRKKATTNLDTDLSCGTQSATCSKAPHTKIRQNLGLPTSLASRASENLTNPKPLLSPVARSLMTLVSSIRPKGSNSRCNSSSLILLGRYPM